MPHNRFFLPEIFSQDGSISMQGNEMHHMKTVMRQKTGDLVELVNGKGQLAIAEITEIGKNHVNLVVQKILANLAEDTRKVEVALSLIRMPRLEWAIEKLTELGATSIFLFSASRSEVEEISENKLHRLHGIMVAAMKQCGSLFLPHLLLYPDLQAIPPIDGIEFYADFCDHKIKTSPTSCRIFIGPESGWTDQERQYLSSRAEQGRIANYTLRAETAAVIGCYNLLL